MKNTLLATDITGETDPVTERVEINPFEKFALNDQVAIITGSAAGIGREIAEFFAAAGASVVVGDLDIDKADSVAEKIYKTGRQAISVFCDVTSEASRMDLVDAALDEFGKVSILVNNAGSGAPQSFDMPLETFEFAYQLNVFSGFHLSQLCALQMEKIGGGSILNISSIAGEYKDKGMTSYASSKAAINHLTRNMAVDLGPKGIRVNAIAPGAIKTAALESILTPEMESFMLRRTPLLRLGEPSDVANAALFLCSPAASWISGQIITVNGGGIQELD